MRKLLLFLILVLSVVLPSCGGDARKLLAYQNGEQSYSLTYLHGATPVTATLWLGEGSEERDFSLTVFGGTDAPDVTYQRKDGAFTATSGGLTLPLTPTEELLLPVSLFCIPTTARVTSIKKEGNARLVTISDGTYIFGLRFEGTNPVPTHISREGNGRYFSLTVQRT